ncbi:MAG: phosphoribosylanthranilate isomerase [Acidobacteriota bacterium]
MSRVKLKVCGITSLADARDAIACGADYLGFNFYEPSPRYVRPDTVRGILIEIAAPVIPVGVFVNLESPEHVRAVMERSGVMMAQLHGNEDATFCAELGSDVAIKVIRPGPGFDPGSLVEYKVAAFLIDAFDKQLYGGTGRKANWEIAREVARLKPVFLAGGLGPENIREAITTVNPFAVDVNSGVESAPGHKDLNKLSQLRLEMDR